MVLPPEKKLINKPHYVMSSVNELNASEPHRVGMGMDTAAVLRDLRIRYGINKKFNRT